MVVAGSFMPGRARLFYGDRRSGIVPCFAAPAGSEVTSSIRREHRFDRAQIVGELRRAGIAHLGALLQREADHVGQRLGQLGPPGAHVGGRLVGDLRHQRVHRIGLERQVAGEQLEQHRAERIDVAAAVDVAAGHLLGRHEARRAEHHARPRAAGVGDARDAEVRRP